MDEERSVPVQLTYDDFIGISYALGIAHDVLMENFYDVLKEDFVENLLDKLGTAFEELTKE